MAEEKLSGLCDWIKRGCDAHTGITAGTFYRDEGWCFYQLGRRDRVRRPDHPPARHQVPELHGPADTTRLGVGQLLLDGAAALGRRLPGVPPPPSARHGAGAGGGVPAVRPLLSRARSPAAWASSTSSSPCCAGCYGLRPPALRPSSWTGSATISRCARSRRRSPGRAAPLRRFPAAQLQRAHQPDRRRPSSATQPWRRLCGRHRPPH